MLTENRKESKKENRAQGINNAATAQAAGKMKATFDFGKINYLGTGKRYPAEVKVELTRRGGDPVFTMNGKEREYTGETTPEYVELSICGNIWNTHKSDIICGGQCLDRMLPYLKRDALFVELYNLWENYHLNGRKAGTPEQEAAIKKWMAAGNRYDYPAACDYLKSINLYEVIYTGKAAGRYYDNELYKYGTAWIVNDLPGDVLLRVEHLISACNANITK